MKIPHPRKPRSSNHPLHHRLLTPGRRRSRGLIVTLSCAAGLACGAVEPPAPQAGTDAALATPNSLQAAYSLDTYTRTFADNPIATLQYGRLSSWGSAYVRINSVHRYGSRDTQVEADAYPRLWSGAYAYLNLGESEGALFPFRRAGAELFSALGGGYEASLGLRHLQFSSGSVTLYTGSLSKYFGNYLLTFRPYVTPGSSGTSVSGGVTLTRYFADADEYLRCTASVGKSIQERSFQTSLSSAISLRNDNIGVAGQWSPMPATLLGMSFDHARQELSFAPGQDVDVNTFTAHLTYRF
jgi:YaiO family outer membrane protein